MPQRLHPLHQTNGLVHRDGHLAAVPYTIQHEDIPTLPHEYTSLAKHTLPAKPHILTEIGGLLANLLSATMNGTCW